jgi:ABC-2 type transport system permease protein
MNKIGLIIKREYLTRIRKRSFIIMSILGPFIFAAFIIMPVWFASIKDTEIKTIAVVDSSHIFEGKIPNTDNLKFKFLSNTHIRQLKKTYKQQGYWGMLFIAPSITYVANAAELISDAQPSLSIKIHIENALEKEIEHQKLLANNINNIEDILKSVETKIHLRTLKLTGEGAEKESDTGIAMIVGYIGGFLIYIFVLLFGAQVMRGIIEEKTNRIVEVIISSVKPFELMMGKIIGIAGTGLTQFIIWIVLTFGLVNVAQKSLFPELSKTPTEQAIAKDVMNPQKNNIIKENLPNDEKTAELKDMLSSIKQINFVVLIGSFIFFFLGGYLLYASLFATVGSAVDNETDTQQFMFPITIPLILGIYVMITTINNPESSLSFWFSLIPLTSPIVMMVRIPFGVPYWQVVISGIILVLTFIGTTWMAAKIYRTGILMYGKKINYKELWKWLTYKS